MTEFVQQMLRVGPTLRHPIILHFHGIEHRVWLVTHTLIQIRTPSENLQLFITDAQHMRFIHNGQLIRTEEGMPDDFHQLFARLCALLAPMASQPAPDWVPLGRWDQEELRVQLIESVRELDYVVFEFQGSTYRFNYHKETHVEVRVLVHMTEKDDVHLPYGASMLRVVKRTGVFHHSTATDPYVNIDAVWLRAFDAILDVPAQRKHTLALIVLKQTKEPDTEILPLDMLRIVAKYLY